MPPIANLRSRAIEYTRMIIAGFGWPENPAKVEQSDKCLRVCVAGRKRVALFGALAVMAILFAWADRTAAMVVYDVLDHPNGALNNGPGQSYMLRLGTSTPDNKPNTFTVATPDTGAIFSFDPSISMTEANLTGTIQHNRDSSGPISGDKYSISATFQAVTFTDPDESAWYGAADTNAVYVDMLSDLLNNSNDTPFNDSHYLTDADRIYFRYIEVTLTPIDGATSYTGPLHWDEYPNIADEDLGELHSKQFFIQKNHRTDDDILTAAGWLEPYVGGEYEGVERATSDFLFALNQSNTVPEPATMWLAGAGLLMIIHRRRKTAALDRLNSCRNQS